MTLIMEIVIPRGFQEEVVEMLKENLVLGMLDMEVANDLILFKISLTTENSEKVLDDLEKRFSYLMVLEYLLSLYKHLYLVLTKYLII